MKIEIQNLSSLFSSHFIHPCVWDWLEFDTHWLIIIIDVTKKEIDLCWWIIFLLRIFMISHFSLQFLVKSSFINTRSKKKSSLSFTSKDDLKPERKSSLRRWYRCSVDSVTNIALMHIKKLLCKDGKKEYQSEVEWLTYSCFDWFVKFLH